MRLLLLTQPPTSRLSWHGLWLAQALLESGTEFKVFFYNDAAAIANGLVFASANNQHIAEQWQQLGIDLPVCVSTALQRGVTDAANATRHQRSAHNLADGFRLTGLGELAELMGQATQVITL